MSLCSWIDRSSRYWANRSISSQVPAAVWCYVEVVSSGLNIDGDNSESYGRLNCQDSTNNSRNFLVGWCPTQLPWRLVKGIRKHRDQPSAFPLITAWYNFSIVQPLLNPISQLSPLEHKYVFPSWNTWYPKLHYYRNLQDLLFIFSDHRLENMNPAVLK